MQGTHAHTHTDSHINVHTYFSGVYPHTVSPPKKTLDQCDNINLMTVKCHVTVIGFKKLEYRLLKIHTFTNLVLNVFFEKKAHTVNITQ